MVEERRGGPGSMSEAELVAFLAAQPSGAICVSDDDGRLLAMPARILNKDGDIVTAEVADAELASAFDDELSACVVADSFETYEAIRGVIAQGPAVRVAGQRPVVALTVARVATFSFATDRRRSRSAQAEPD
ncbi:Uncharacterised protein [Mycolicibacterium gilvum]|uniref:Pyridoxamine 5'-phosphate oxidase n=3 Tax=Mycobacteriaceae TaxID=1762 RepID=A0A7I7K456_9MYCO|nr:hypothetical protein MDUV_30220 [Mycolicibacterium duvalii]STZ46413.1 Uncharacterised protein [Mycolicibacterium gilvum]